MRDRTLIMLALLFLTLTIGSGVNKSLEACNGMMGKSMAPSFQEVYSQQVPDRVNRLQVFAEKGMAKSESIALRSYPVITGNIKKMQVTAGMLVRDKAAVLWSKFSKVIKQVRERAEFEKNRFIR